MVFWKLWIVGIMITVITKYSLNKSLRGRSDSFFSVLRNERYISKLDKKIQILLHLLVIVCIILVGGITVAKFVGMFYTVPFWRQILIGIIPALLTYYVGYMILELSDFDDKRSQVCFVIVFIISIFGWTILINNYNRNIEEVSDVVIEQTQERKLLYFCNVPVQEVTGKINGGSSILGGSVSGSIDTTHELTYWYVNEDGKGLFDTAPANSSEIEFLNEGTPYVEILNYYQYRKSIDHNTGYETMYEEIRWTQYVFHLPKTIMQYILE